LPSRRHDSSSRQYLRSAVTSCFPNRIELLRGMAIYILH
jgi:hypothetical protein